MLSFAGLEPPAELLAGLARQHLGGVTLFRALNVKDPAQVRRLTEALQRAAAEAGQPRLIIAADQEGGQLMAVGDGPTAFPGNLALGAAGSADLARQAGYAMGMELAALGINVNYAPVCDVQLNPRNAVVGTRSFGEDPALVARMCAAMVEGIQAAGVAATAKHFPGHGDTADDSHFGTAVLPHDEARLRRVELPPFAAAVQAGARLVMPGHIALPGLGGAALPATLSAPTLRGLLRGELGFDGVIISDALDMKAIEQGPGLVIDAIAATAAGVDMLLLNIDAAGQRSVYAGLVQAARRGLLAEADVLASAERVLALKEWLGRREQPRLEVVGCAEHKALALDIATRAITLVRDRAGRLPLRPAPEARLAVVAPRPADLTPADTSSYVVPALGEALRRYHPAVDDFVIPLDPGEADIAALRQRLSEYDLVIAGTINAGEHPGQAALVNALLAAGVPLAAAALRMPYDLAAYPAAPTYLCAYSIVEPAMQALAAALFGRAPCEGRLPVTIPSLD
jgi:beta-N-acetylhexosaminidase